MRLDRNSLSNRFYMNRFLLFATLIGLIGCDSSTPKPGAAPISPSQELIDNDRIKVVPGPSDPDAPQEFTTTESGLKYRILRRSEGKKPTAEDRVRVHYRGTFDNGELFDTSYGKTGSAVEFPLNGVAKGWTEGLLLIGEGGMIELEVPPELGYGKDGSPPTIPPNATLHFLVELLNVK